jgi:hypothetical protein
MTGEYRSEAEALADALPPPTARFDLPGGESTSAALHRTEQERDEALESWRAAVDHAARVEKALAAQRDLARVEVEQLRTLLAQIRIKGYVGQIGGPDA